MSTPLRAVYRGGSTSYSYNYGGELAANRGGFELLPSDYPPTSVPGSGTITYLDPLFVGDTISSFASCAGGLISWYRVDTSTGNRFLITQGSSSYTTVSGDTGFAIEAEVGCPDPFSPTGFGTNGSAGITSVVQPPFDPTTYLYFRWAGSVRKQQSGCTFQITNPFRSAWRGTSNNNYGKLCFAGSGEQFAASFERYSVRASGAIVYIEPLDECGIPWVANGYFLINGIGPNIGLSSQQIGTVRDSDPGINYMAGFGAASATSNCDPIAVSTDREGRWQFSNDSSVFFAGNSYIPADMFEWRGL
jgi:hypothetical protein